MNKSTQKIQDVDLEGQLLIAMPGMPDERFARSVVCLCAHSDEGAMGLIINKPTHDLSLSELLQQVDLDDDEEAVGLAPNAVDHPIHNGGPVESSRGFVLHSPDYFSEDATIKITDGICLTATTDVLKAVASGKGPKRSMLALGYAGWAPGQLESELGANGWLNCPADPDLVFARDAETKYSLALTKLGVNPSHLVSIAGRA